ncbi:MAG: HAMP domain-containing sensor histidine kinase [Gaiellaceae bacterium]|jgi:signal transduction histidine kinase
MRPRLNSIRAQLFAAIGLILLLSAALTLGVGGLLTRRAVDQATLRDLSHQADLLAHREQTDILPLARLPELGPYLARQNERVVILSSLGSASRFVSEKTLHQLRAGQAVDGSITIAGASSYFAARPLGRKAFVLLRPHRNASADWLPFLNALAIAAAAGMLLAGLISLLLGRLITRPLRRVALASRALAEQGVSEPVPLEGATELRSLAVSFNEMAEQLSVAREAEKAFLLSVSHELRTPLASVRGYSEALADGAIAPAAAAETIGTEALRLERLVGDLLDLARVSRSEFSIRSGRLDLGDVAREALARFQTQAEAFGIQLEIASNGPAPALGDYDRVLQVASNLIENAIRITPPGGSVRISVAPGTLSVEDTGPGLAPEEVAHAFERFYLYSRYGRDRAVGTGLGLAIVKELVDGMGGTVSVASKPGAGTSFSVRLPLDGETTEATTGPTRTDIAR